MRVRDHVVLSTAATLALHPLPGFSGLGFWASGVLIDTDHYMWFCLRSRAVGPIAAVRYFNQAHPPNNNATRALHTPAAVLAAMALGMRRPEFRPVAAGMGLHVALDAAHEALMARARTRALERDRFSCRNCGDRAPNIGTHVWRQPPVLPSYRTHNLVSLCGACHELAHSPAGRRVRWA